MSGARLWAQTLAVYEMSEHELAVLRQAVVALDTADQLDALISQQGYTVVGSKGGAVLNPCVAEARQQRITVARLLAALRLPDVHGGRGQLRSGVRGVHGVARGRRGAAS